MNYSVHVTVGTATGIGVCIAARQMGYNLSPILVIIPAYIGAALPDIDHPKSHLGRRLKLVSRFVNKAFGHRGFTHSLLFCTLVGWFLYNVNQSIGIGAFFGILSHILLDMLTPFSKGVALLYPIKKRIGLFKA